MGVAEAGRRGSEGGGGGGGGGALFMRRCMQRHLEFLRYFELECCVTARGIGGRAFECRVSGILGFRFSSGSSLAREYCSLSRSSKYSQVELQSANSRLQLKSQPCPQKELQRGEKGFGTPIA